MKRIAPLVSVTAILLLPATPALGQTALLSLGLNRASVSVTGEEDELTEYLEPVTRMSAGVAVGIPLLEGWSVELGGSYSQKGYAVDVPQIGDGSAAIDYLEVTALASVAFPLGDRASVNLLAGPALAMQLSCQVTLSFEGSEESEDCDPDDSDDGPKDSDLGLAGGLRFRIGLSEKMGVTVGALYTLGLQNLFEGVDEDDSVKNRVMTLSAGLAYSIR